MSVAGFPETEEGKIRTKKKQWGWKNNNHHNETANNIIGDQSQTNSIHAKQDPCVSKIFAFLWVWLHQINVRGFLRILKHVSDGFFRAIIILSMTNIFFRVPSHGWRSNYFNGWSGYDFHPCLDGDHGKGWFQSKRLWGAPVFVLSTIRPLVLYAIAKKKEEQDWFPPLDISSVYGCYYIQGILETTTYEKKNGFLLREVFRKIFNTQNDGHLDLLWVAIFLFIRVSSKHAKHTIS